MNLHQVAALLGGHPQGRQARGDALQFPQILKQRDQLYCRWLVHHAARAGHRDDQLLRGEHQKRFSDGGARHPVFCGHGFFINDLAGAQGAAFDL